MKKGQGLSLGYVVVGIIAVVVLVVIILIFTGGLGSVKETQEEVIKNCPYEWLSKEDCEEAGGSVEKGVFADALENLGKVCCNPNPENNNDDEEEDNENPDENKVIMSDRALDGGG